MIKIIKNLTQNKKQFSSNAYKLQMKYRKNKASVELEQIDEFQLSYKDKALSIVSSILDNPRVISKRKSPTEFQIQLQKILGENSNQLKEEDYQFSYQQQLRKDYLELFNNEKQFFNKNLFPTIQFTYQMTIRSFERQGKDIHKEIVQIQTDKCIFYQKKSDDFMNEIFKIVQKQDNVNIDSHLLMERNQLETLKVNSSELIFSENELQLNKNIEKFINNNLAINIDNFRLELHKIFDTHVIAILHVENDFEYEQVMPGLFHIINSSNKVKDDPTNFVPKPKFYLAKNFDTMNLDFIYVKDKIMSSFFNISYTKDYDGKNLQFHLDQEFCLYGGNLIQEDDLQKLELKYDINVKDFLSDTFVEQLKLHNKGIIKVNISNYNPLLISISIQNEDQTEDFSLSALIQFMVNKDSTIDQLSTSYDNYINIESNSKFKFIAQQNKQKMIYKIEQIKNIDSNNNIDIDESLKNNSIMESRFIFNISDTINNNSQIKSIECTSNQLIINYIHDNENNVHQLLNEEIENYKLVNNLENISINMLPIIAEDRKIELSTNQLLDQIRVYIQGYSNPMRIYVQNLVSSSVQLQQSYENMEKASLKDLEQKKIVIETRSGKSTTINIAYDKNLNYINSYNQCIIHLTSKDKLDKMDASINHLHLYKREFVLAWIESGYDQQCDQNYLDENDYNNNKQRKYIEDKADDLMDVILYLIDTKLISAFKIGVVAYDIAAITLIKFQTKYPYNIQASTIQSGIFDICDVFMNDIQRFNSQFPKELQLHSTDDSQIDKLNEFALSIPQINPVNVKLNEGIGKLMLFHVQNRELAYQTLEMTAILREQNDQIVKEKGLIAMYSCKNEYDKWVVVNCAFLTKVLQGQLGFYPNLARTAEKLLGVSEKKGKLE